MRRQILLGCVATTIGGELHLCGIQRHGAFVKESGCRAKQQSREKGVIARYSFCKRRPYTHLIGTASYQKVLHCRTECYCHNFGLVSLNFEFGIKGCTRIPAASGLVKIEEMEMGLKNTNIMSILSSPTLARIFSRVACQSTS